MAGSARWLAALLLTATPAAAQTQPSLGYFGVTAGAHFERSDAMHADAPSIGLVGGVRLTRAWGAEIEYDRPTHALVRDRTCQCFSFAATREDFARLAVTEQLRDSRDVLSTLSIGAVYQPPLGRWTPRVFMGATRHRVRTTSQSTIVSVPAGYETRLNESRTFVSTRTLGGPTIGGGLSYQLTPHLSVGGDARYDYGSLGDEINNAWRTSMRTTWTF